MRVFCQGCGEVIGQGCVSDEQAVVFAAEGAVDPGKGLYQQRPLRGQSRYKVCRGGESKPVSIMSLTMTTKLIIRVFESLFDGVVRRRAADMVRHRGSI